MEAQQEIWKDVVGYEGKYQISSYGRVRTIDMILHKRDGKSEFRKGRIIKQRLSIHGYPQYLFSNGTGSRKMMRVHRVVAMAFIPNPENKPCIDHINTIKTDNRVENLKWATHSENNRNPITMTKFRKKGEFHHSEKTKEKIGIAFRGRKLSSETKLKMKRKGFPVIQMSLDGDIIKEFDSSHFAQDELGICAIHIADVCRGTRKSAGGFKWKYKNDNR